MKILKLNCICASIVIIVLIVMNTITNHSKNYAEYYILLEENKHLNLLRDQECIKNHEIEFCDKFQSSWKCREIKSLAMDFAEKDKNDDHYRNNYINNHHSLVHKYINECLK